MFRLLPLAALVTIACAPVEAPPAAEVSIVRVSYACENGPPLTVVFDNRARTATIEGDPPIVLPQAPSGSGFLYETPRHRLQGKGDELMYTIGRAVPRKCTSGTSAGEPSDWASTDAHYAKLRAQGVDWVAVGQEPGWIARVKDGEQISVDADYGERKAVVPAPAANAPGVAVEYHSVTEAHDVRLTITREACSDSMSGRPYPARAVLMLDGRRYEGCAQPL